MATFTVSFTASEVLYTDKKGRPFSGDLCARLLSEDWKRAIGYAASREATLERDKARKEAGAMPATVYVGAANKLPAPVKAPVAPLDLSDPLEVAVAVELAAPAPVKAPEAPKASARKATKNPTMTELVQPILNAEKAPKAAPVVETIATVAPASKMDAFKASAAAKLAAKLAAKKAANDAREAAQS